MFDEAPEGGYKDVTAASCSQWGFVSASDEEMERLVTSEAFARELAARGITQTLMAISSCMARLTRSLSSWPSLSCPSVQELFGRDVRWALEGALGAAGGSKGLKRKRRSRRALHRWGRCAWSRPRRPQSASRLGGASRTCLARRAGRIRSALQGHASATPWRS